MELMVAYAYDMVPVRLHRCLGIEPDGIRPFVMALVQQVPEVDDERIAPLIEEIHEGILEYMHPASCPVCMDIGYDGDADHRGDIQMYRHLLSGKDAILHHR